MSTCRFQILMVLALLTCACEAQILVAGQNSSSIGVFDRNGNLISLEPVGFMCGDIAVDAIGDIFVCSNNGELRRFDSNFTLITSWSRGTTTYGIAIRPSNGNVFICGSGSADVREYNTTGGFVRDWSPGGGNIRDIAFDSSDNMWVTSFTCNCIRVLSPASVSLPQIAPAGMSAPFGLSMGPGNLIWANNQNDHRVMAIDETTFQLTSAFVPTAFSGQYRNMGIDDLGQIYVGQHSSGLIDVYTSAGAYVRTFSTPGLSGIHSVHYVGTIVPPAPTCTLVLTSVSPVRETGAFEVNAASTSALTVDAIYSFSTDAGATWIAATPAPGSSNPALGIAVMTPTAFEWDSLADGVALPAPISGVLMQAVIDDGTPTLGTCVTAPFDVDNSPLCNGICGDCNLNALGPDILDALEAARISAGLVVPSAQQLVCCDVNISTTIDILDALATAQVAAGLPVAVVCF